MPGHRRIAALSIASAVTAFWLTLYRSPTYPPVLGLSLAIAGALFLASLVFLYRVHAHAWPALAKLGFAISAVGLSLWIAGPIVEILRGPQAGWGLFCVGLLPIGATAITNRLALSIRLLLPVSSLLVLGEPLKYLLGERTGGLTVLVTFGLGWLAIGILLLLETSGQPRPKQS